jgi:hypothetical protein
LAVIATVEGRPDGSIPGGAADAVHGRDVYWTAAHGLGYPESWFKADNGDHIPKVRGKVVEVDGRASIHQCYASSQSFTGQTSQTGPSRYSWGLSSASQHSCMATFDPT